VRGGYDFVGDVWPAADPRCGAQQICTVPDDNPLDLSGHGTHVADVAAGLPTTPGGADGGVAPGASLWAFKACNGAESLCEGVALLAALDAALDLDGSDRGRCTPGVDAGCRTYDPADVINLSLSFSYGQPEDALSLFANIAGFYGSLVVAAAGNDGDKPYIVGAPATADAALAVAESSFPPPPSAPAAEPPASNPTISPPQRPRPAPIRGAVAFTATLTETTGEQIAADASRGPRIADNGIKPDLAAPGAVSSAQAGSGSGLAPFGGSSGSAPVAGRRRQQPLARAARQSRADEQRLRRAARPGRLPRAGDPAGRRPH
jgi:subtilisin family serine protease